MRIHVDFTLRTTVTVIGFITLRLIKDKAHWARCSLSRTNRLT
mgnify:CR=1 FL=1